MSEMESAYLEREQMESTSLSNYYLWTVQQIEHQNIGAFELVSSNGMRVCYKCTDFLDDQVLFSGFSYGGLSELPESEYFSCKMSSTIAGEFGAFGYRPSILTEMLAGKRAQVSTELGTYTRTVYGDCSPSDLKTALQPITIEDLQKVNLYKACEYYSNCFKDPSTFTMLIVGNIDPATACPLILQYLVKP
ncbi:hypothetical protein DM860_004048 [Cuscuta australis]|uniref:Peptidase M16 C-terminal domain-containing protein n=1 Tax=Cuscuta australis TaxID=267555 RepID=A0A328CVW5_9ASTE|nr:hypothetical protein DM860_004048 [Cuscuta australis]